MPFTIGGETLTFPELVIEVNNTVELIEDWAAVNDRGDATMKTGYAYAKITAREVRYRLSCHGMSPDDPGRRGSVHRRDDVRGERPDRHRGRQ